MKKKALLVAGSPENDSGFLSGLDFDDFFIIAADSGYNHCMRSGLRPDVIVGDMDSIQAENGIETVEQVRLSTRKDHSDTFYALKKYIDSFDIIYLANSLGGRADHAFFNYFAPLSFGEKVVILTKGGYIQYVTPNLKHNVETEDGRRFSLLPLETCEGVVAEGCEYPLDGAVIRPDTFTLSNIKRGTLSLSYLTGNMLLFIEGLPPEIKRKG